MLIFYISSSNVIKEKLLILFPFPGCFLLYSEEYLGVEEGEGGSRYEAGEEDSTPVLVVSGHILIDLFQTKHKKSMYRM